ncbi:MAG: phytanoyl-CoA dioxygenase family protein [Armatimonadetes bacterium]|nr:phytanoyl-CoA dioxygenase family protein [Armatimonadota bacterium]MDE2206466.1 phytanoyl-CoA dioxygenase family protein [Armatimonadota bacterium]
MTPDQIKQFRSEGWTCVPALFNAAETRTMRNEIQHLQASGRLRNVATDGDARTTSRTQFNLQLCPLSPHSEAFRCVPHLPSVVAAVDALIGVGSMLHLDQVFLKPPHTGAGTAWHQDNAYFHISDPTMGTAMWIAIDDATTENGTLRVVPRRQRDQLNHERDPFSDHHIRCFPEESEAVTVELEAGGAVFFCYGTPHCTGANPTQKSRAGVALHFVQGDALPGGGFPATDGLRHASISGPLADRALQQELRATWNRLVRSTEDAGA